MKTKPESTFCSINRRERRFHDPWGNKNGNRYGSIIRWQYQVAQSEIESYFGETSINKQSGS